MRVWSDSLAGVAGVEWEPVEVKPYGNHVGEYVDEGTVPASAPYKRVLDFRPVRGKLSITIAGTPATLIEWGTSPSGTGVVAVDWVGGQLEFAAADAGAAVVATMAEHYGTVVDAGMLNALQAELAAAQAAIQAGNVYNVYTVGPAGSGAQYATVQAALDAIPAIGSGEGERTGTWVVRVLPGEYPEAVQVHTPQVVLELLPGAVVVSEDPTWIGNMESVPNFPILVVASDVLVTGGGEAHNPSLTGSSCAIVIGLNGETGEVEAGWEIAPHRVNVVGVRAIGRHRDTVVITNSASEDCAINGCYVEGYYDVISASGTRSSVVSNRVKTIHPTNGTRGGAPFWAGRFGPSGAGCKAMFAFNVCEFDGSRWINITGQADVLLDNNTMVTDVSIARQPVNLAAAGTGATAAVGTLRIGNQPHSGDLWAAGGDFSGVTVHRLTTRTGIVVSDGEVTANATGTPRTLSTAIQQSTLTAKGSILTATAASTPAALAVPSTAGPWILRPNAATATGLEWIQRGVVANLPGMTDTLYSEFQTGSAYTDWATTITIPANTLVAGSVWRVRFSAEGYSDNGSSSNGRIRLGTAQLLEVGSFDGHGEITLSCIITVLTTGTTGTVAVEAERLVMYGNHTTCAAQASIAGINTTVASQVSAGIFWGVPLGVDYATLVVARLERLA